MSVDLSVDGDVEYLDDVHVLSRGMCLSRFSCILNVRNRYDGLECRPRLNGFFSACAFLGKQSRVRVNVNVECF